MLNLTDKKAAEPGYTGDKMGSAATRLTTMIGTEVSARDFSARMASAPALSGLNTTPDQLLEVLGGIVNLYDEKSLELGLTEFDVETEHGFVSKYVSLPSVLSEIGYASGYKERACAQILTALESTLRSYINPKMPNFALNLKFLGIIRPISLENSTYQLHYRSAR
jgi:hypothetical protein